MADLLAPFLTRPLQAERPAASIDPDRIEEASKLLLGGTPDAAQARARIEQAEALLRLAPQNEMAQETLLRLWEASRRKADMADSWQAFSDRFPRNRTGLRMALRWMRRAGRLSDARTLADRHAGNPALMADLLVELGDRDGAVAAARDALACSRKPVRSRQILARHLLAAGRIAEARAEARHLETARLSPTGRKLLDDIGAAARALDTLDRRRAETRNAQPSARALHAALDLFAQRRPRLVSGDGPVTFVTGSLAAGGAERQCSMIAAALQERRRARGSGPVDMVVTDASSSSDRGHFRPVLDAAEVPLTDLSRTPDCAMEGDSQLGRLVPLLPAQAQVGLLRLLPHLRQRQPDTVYIWQDGAVLMAALAALVAGVPRILISLRGLPPNLRTDRDRAEYHDMYRALATIPGVTLTANSRPAADAYRDWLGLPADGCRYLPNAVAPLPAEAPLDQARLWKGFADRLGPDPAVLGGIFRFTANKRPQDWIAVAARAMAAHPGLACILVGDGPDRAACETLASDLGIRERILFTGETAHVGFWLGRMDLFMLLSRFEGLPNVLIEAQMAGLPVISTPAGGAADTFLPGRSGLLLPSADPFDPDAATMAVLDLLGNRARAAAMGATGRTFAAERFALPRILDATELLLAGQPLPDMAPAVPPQAAAPPDPGPAVPHLPPVQAARSGASRHLS
ncbi:glycosyltransferase [Oceanomicrobium pacificus]|uniref:Glycosyltransferase n=1 Tax=Oceanomicrobium pacificus TaxID=2692916 RepID=A0A6B0TY50_9RHOB|nr:glycosyltransferase [Oceanomicrobium pacificus]MXU65984.1 glycosyltransferase [Oceanomicrobium pacificus]